MKYNVKTIDEYMDAIPADRIETIQKLIDLVDEYFPEIEGTMEYNMPTFHPVCSIASQKNHISVYIHYTDLVEKYRTDLGKLKVGKSCIRFKKPEDIPENGIRKIFTEIKKSI